MKAEDIILEMETLAQMNGEAFSPICDYLLEKREMQTRPEDDNLESYEEQGAKEESTQNKKQRKGGVVAAFMQRVKRYVKSEEFLTGMAIGQDCVYGAEFGAFRAPDYMFEKYRPSVCEEYDPEMLD